MEEEENREDDDDCSTCHSVVGRDVKASDEQQALHKQRTKAHSKILIMNRRVDKLFVDSKASLLESMIERQSYIHTLSISMKKTRRGKTRNTHTSLIKAWSHE